MNIYGFSGKTRENGPDTSMLILWEGRILSGILEKLLFNRFIPRFFSYALRSSKIFNQDPCHPSNSDRRSSTNRNENFQSDRDSFK